MIQNAVLVENVKRCVFLIKDKRKLNGGNMRKVGIITIPDYNNYGNRLQNYAVKKYFENKGFKVETLEMNDKSFEQRNARKIKLYLKKYHLTFLTFLFEAFSKGINNAFRYLKFEKFTRKHLNVKYIPQWEDNVVEKIGNEYSYIVLGSDQIWHPYVNTTPNLFFGLFVNPRKRLFFAPSFGVESLSREYSNLVQKSLEGVENISVREKAGKNILEKLTNADVTVLCDPTLLLPQNEWSKIAIKPKKIPKKYILSYFLGHVSQKYTEASEKIEKELGSECYRIANKSDRNSFITGPSEFIYAIKNAQFVITDSFHAVAFSLIFKKPFLVCSRLNDKGESEGLDSRIDLLLGMFGMEHRKYSEDLNYDDLMNPIDNIDGIFNEQRHKAKKYFDKIN